MPKAPALIPRAYISRSHCEQCQMQYIGKTKRTLSDRVREHMISVDKREKTMGQHFNLPHHSKAKGRQCKMPDKCNIG